MTNDNKMDEQTLAENLFDAIAASRFSIRVRSTKPTAENAETFVVSFLMNVPAETHEALCAAARVKQRTVASLLRRYVVAAFKFFIEADDDEEEEKEAA